MASPFEFDTCEPFNSLLLTGTLHPQAGEIFRREAPMNYSYPPYLLYFPLFLRTLLPYCCTRMQAISGPQCQYSLVILASVLRLTDGLC